jgi:D-inositol-3-phosphate glycosyltransferase
MKIGFIITSTGWGGLEMNTIKLSTSLNSLGYSITLFTQEESTIFKKNSPSFESSVLIKRNKKYFDFKTAKQIATVLKEKEISTILIFDNKDLDVIAWAKSLYYKDLKIVYQQHMQIGIPKKNPLQTFRFKTIDKWISPLDYLIKEIGIQTKFPTDRIVKIPIGVDTERFFKNTTSKEEALTKLSIDNSLPLVGIIGRISEKKGQLFLLETMLKLKKEGVNFNLLIFGSATVNDLECQNYNTKIHDFTKSNNLTEKVYFIEHQENISLFYNSIDIFVLASESETYGMVTIEAMLSELPILATKSGGTSDILQNGKFGKLYKYGSHSELAKELKWTLNKLEEAKNMGQLAKVNALQTYTLDKEVTKIDKLLNSL